MSSTRFISEVILTSQAIHESVRSVCVGDATLVESAIPNGHVNINIPQRGCCYALDPVHLIRPPKYRDDEFESLVSKRERELKLCRDAAKYSASSCNLNPQSSPSHILQSIAMTHDTLNGMINIIVDIIMSWVEAWMADPRNVLDNSFVITGIRASVTNSITSELTLDIISNLRDMSGQDNHSYINMCGGVLSGKMCALNQDSSIEMYISNVVGSIASICSRNTVLNRLYNAVKYNEIPLVDPQVSPSHIVSNDKWHPNNSNVISGSEKGVLMVFAGIVVGGAIISCIYIGRKSKNVK